VTRPRVRIVQLSAEALAALADGDHERATTLSPVPLSRWLASAENAWTWGYRARQVIDHPEDLPWVTGVTWDVDAGATVGRAGFHGAPDPTGTLELGYATDPAFRRRGYARAAFEPVKRRTRTSCGPRSPRATLRHWRC
jgi:ribosomal-protein-alanine N-acetyltransferase